MYWRKFPDVKPNDGQLCIVSAAPHGQIGIAQIVPVMWNERNQEFTWHEQVEENFDPYPTEITTHWFPWPDDPK
jgi:hypothetical protein